MAHVRCVICVSGGYAGGVVLAPASLQGSRVSFASENPKSKFCFLSSSPPTISPKNGAIKIVIAISCCDFFGSAKECRYAAPLN